MTAAVAVGAGRRTGTAPKSGEPGTGAQRNSFAVDCRASGTARGGLDFLRHEWDTQDGETSPSHPFPPGVTGDFRLSVRASKVHDAVIADIHNESFLCRTLGARNTTGEWALIHVVQRGRYRFTQPRDHSQIAIVAGQFIVRHDSPPTHYDVERHSTAKLILLPASLLQPLLGDRQIIGPADSAEVRLLMAHANMIDATVDDLAPAGAQAARNALIELAKAVVRRGIDANEPLLAPALAQAAKDIVDSRLADPHLSPRTVARELNVSVRTLHRAFTTSEESVTAYIRRRRLEQARLELTSPTGRASISEVAAHWQFTDNSHFTRAFKKQYGQTPTQFTQSSKSTAPATDGHPKETAPR